MLLQLSSDQEFFRDTTAKFLGHHVPSVKLRGLRDDPAGFEAEYWRRGAELGWTSLLVDEAHGGGSLSGDGLIDLTVVAHEFGRTAAPGPLVSTNVVAGALSRHGAHPAVLEALLTGSSIATWCLTEAPPDDRPGDVNLQVRADGDELVINGVKRPVEAAAQASHLLVTGRTGRGLTQVLVPADTPGLSITPLRSADLTRRFSVVAFNDVRVSTDAALGEVGAADADVAQQVRQTLVLLTAEAVGSMQTAFDLTLEWAFDRYSFGRPIASYQALKHRFADMRTWLEASHAIADHAAAAVASESPDADEQVSAAKAFIGDFGSELMHECVQLHGGIGVTFEHDLHLYLRRQTVNRALLGTPSQHRQRLTDLLEQRQVKA